MEKSSRGLFEGKTPAFTRTDLEKSQKLLNQPVASASSLGYIAYLSGHTIQYNTKQELYARYCFLSCDLVMAPLKMATARRNMLG